MSALHPSDLEEDARDGVAGELFAQGSEFLTLDPLDVLGSDSVSMVSQDTFENNKLAAKTLPERSAMTVDADAKDVSAINSEVNSPRETVSPTASSPFSAMESDGEGVETGQDDANLSCAGDQSFNRGKGYFGASTPLYTTTPCASSSCCDEDYDTSGSRKKRRKTRRDMQHFQHGFSVSVVPASKQTAQDWPQDSETSPFSPPTCPKGLSFAFASQNGRRASGGGINPGGNAMADEFPHENAKRTRKCTEQGDEEMANIKQEPPCGMDTTAAVQSATVAKRGSKASSQDAQVSGEEEQLLHKQYPRKSGSYELHIITQPEHQHRARYLTEGSRGPVKDETQTGFPKVQLLGYNKPVTLQVFVANDAGKIKPHGFYQACRVTGRNTSACEETEIEGTKVIEIPFKQEDGSMILSVDCVGILKLRNTDVEVRTGLRNQKRNQSVRLVFRVVLNTNTGPAVVLQAASTRISCTQPLGQPEITKKSIDRCSVEGGTEMFIIGKNFHRGTKVVYQDPEEPDNRQWSAEGEIEKDTFHQYHMVVRVPPYHDLNIAKPVNVQLIVEFQDKKCEPHSFTYTPRPKCPGPAKDVAKPVVSQASSDANIETALNLLDGPIDKKFLVALFSKLLTNSQGEGQNAGDTSDVKDARLISNPQSLLNAVFLGNQSAKSVGQVANPGPVSPPSTMLAGISVQTQPIVANSLTGNAQLQVAQTFAAGHQTVIPGNGVLSDVSHMKLIKSEDIASENPAFSASGVPIQSLPALIQGRPLSAATASVTQTAAENAACSTMVISTVSGQTSQDPCYNSFMTSQAGLAAPVNNGVSVFPISGQHQTGVADIRKTQGQPTVNAFINAPQTHQNVGVGNVSFGANAGGMQSFPVANFQVATPVNQGQQGAATMPSAGHAPANQYPQIFSQGPGQITVHNSAQISAQSNVLQQPTFTFQNATPIVSTAVQNLQAQPKPVLATGVLDSGQAFGNQVRFTIGVADMNVTQQSMAVDQQTATDTNQQQPFTLVTRGFSAGNVQQPFATDSKQQQAMPSFATSVSSSASHASSPFVVAAPNQVYQQINAQTQPSTAPMAHQANAIFQNQFTAQAQHTDLHGAGTLLVDSNGKRLHTEQFGGLQNTIHHTTISTLNAQPEQQAAAVQPMDGVLTQNSNESVGSDIVLQDQHMQAAVTRQPVPMATEPSPPSVGSDVSSPHSDNLQPAGFAMSGHSFQTSPPVEAPMHVEPVVNQQSMELEQPNPNYQMQQQQHFQGSQSAAMHSNSSFTNQVNFHAGPVVTGSNSTSITIHAFGAQQQTSQGSGQGASLQRDVVAGNFMQTMQDATQIGGQAQNFQTNPIANEGQNFQANPMSNENKNFQVNPMVNETQNFQANPIANEGRNFQVTPMANEAQNFQANPIANEGRNFQVNPMVNETQNFQANPIKNEGRNFQVTPMANEAQNFQANPMVNETKNFQANPVANEGQNFQANPMANESQNFQSNPVANESQNFQANPMANARSGNNLEGYQQNLQQQMANTTTNFQVNLTGNSPNANPVNNGQPFQGMQAQNMNISANLQGNAINMGQQQLPAMHQGNGNIQVSVVGVDNFQSQTNVKVTPTQPQAETVTSSGTQPMFQNLPTQNVAISGQSYQTVNQQHIDSSANREFAEPQNPEQHLVNGHQQSEAAYSYNAGHVVQNPALPGQGLHQGACANNTVDGHPRSPDIYAMTQLLQSISGSENLASFTDEDVRRHFQ